MKMTLNLLQLQAPRPPIPPRAAELNDLMSITLQFQNTLRAAILAENGVAMGTPDRESPFIIVHLLREGQTPCQVSKLCGIPAQWPLGHRWDRDARKVTCLACLKILEREH